MRTKNSRNEMPHQSVVTVATQVLNQHLTTALKLALFLLLTLSSTAFALEDPTGGKPFFAWIWQDQLQPTIKESVSSTGLKVATATLATTIVSHQYDSDVYEHNRRGRSLLFDPKTSGRLGTLGGGGLGIGITLVQLFFDQKNGLKHGRAIFLTATNHVLLAFVASRQRPDGRPDYLPFHSAFPSGHASSVFATATSLAYAYGWKTGVPSFALAAAISGARVSENAHWLSDVVSGAGLGIFWAVASYRVNEKIDTVQILPPMLTNSGFVISAQIDF